MDVSTPLARRALALALCCATASGWAADAASLGSAFRPQASDVAPAAPAAPGTAPAPAAAAETPAGLRIVVSGKGRAVASIDGRLVHVGDTVNGMRVAHIGAQEVLLVGEGGAKERLYVNPMVVNSKRPVQAPRTGTEGVRR